MKLSRDLELYQQVEQCLTSFQPDLRLKRSSKRIVIDGSYQVRIEGVVHDSFEVRIEIDPQFPEVAPMLFECAGRIPRELGRHMYPDREGMCCYGVWAEWLATGPRTVERFLVETVHDFFFSQAYYEAHPELDERERWPLGGRSHGLQGVVETCAKILGVPANLEVVLDAISYILGEEYDRNGECICGSGRRFKRCHRSKLWELKSTLDHLTVKEMLASLKNP